MTNRPTTQHNSIAPTLPAAALAEAHDLHPQRKLAEDEAYISYFNERIKIEQSYVEALNKLHAKQVGADSQVDE